MNVIHHNYLRIFANENLLYKGEVLIYQDNSCEGIFCDNANNQNYVSGIFVKYKYLNLIIDGNTKKEIFSAEKKYLKYEGTYRIIENDIINDVPFYLKASSLDVDPRDYYLENNPLNLFEEKLDKFKKEKGIDNNFNDNLNVEEPDEKSKIK